MPPVDGSVNRRTAPWSGPFASATPRALQKRFHATLRIAGSEGTMVGRASELSHRPERRVRELPGPLLVETHPERGKSGQFAREGLGLR